ncbi:MAG: hypothetical protein AVDCRST_MAG86-475 [uncultured Truepera sp.]|uniref:Uncharacterized protein n=1 Tax=uncultured Truepera sp. TaxID=543023 RepID=A0A6J4US43_9DEIN|nr:MAG: hypothetical protein AVDCRST_MAG86-475 [uncultured Truepera sp.]
MGQGQRDAPDGPVATGSDDQVTGVAQRGGEVTFSVGRPVFGVIPALAQQL